MIIAATIIGVLTVAAILSFIFRPKNSSSSISFKESINLVGLPIVTFYQGNQKLHFLLDTGADTSVLNQDILKSIDYKGIEAYTKVIGISGGFTEAQLVETVIYLNDRGFKWTFSVMDMSNVNETIGLVAKGAPVVICGILGSDFFKNYQYILNFEKMIAYSKL